MVKVQLRKIALALTLSLVPESFTPHSRVVSFGAIHMWRLSRGSSGSSPFA